jgi:hypothetical protein
VAVGGNPLRSGAQASSWINRHVVALGVVLVAMTATGGFFLFARPAYHPPGGGVTIRIPAKSPAADAAGAAGWVWRDGVPGWQAGETLHGYQLSGVQPIEIQAAQLAAARQLLDASKVRVLTAIRGDNAKERHTFPPRVCRKVQTQCFDQFFRRDRPTCRFLAGR